MISARRRPSAAMVVALAGAAMALAALVVSMAGTATGLPGTNRIDRNDLRKRVVGPINIQRNAVRPYQLAPDAVRPFHMADPSSLVRAWAKVSAAGTLEDGANVNGVVPDGAGRYCFDLPFTPSAGVVTLRSDAANLDFSPPLIQITGSFLCPQGFQDARVSTGTQSTGGADANAGFFAIFN